MAQILEDVTQLSQDIGPRPAGTEEEQQAALYIADRFNKGAGMEADVEDFKCVPDYEMVRIVLFGVALLAALVAFLFDVAAIPAVIIGLVAAVLFALELIDRPVVSRFFERGISQNVIARYVPPEAEGASSARRRKVILVAHYDSGRAMPEMVGPVVKLLLLFQKLSTAAVVLVPILLLIKHFAFAHSAGVLALLFNVLIIVGMVLIVLALGRTVLHRTQPYNDAANCNAAGVSVLMEIARRVAAGRVSEEEIAAREAVIHGEEAAREAGLVPEGARLTYEASQKKGPDAAPQSEEARLASAKAAIAALTGKPVEGAAEVSSISENLVQVEPELPEATDELRHEQNMEIMNAFTGGTASSSSGEQSGEMPDENKEEKEAHDAAGVVDATKAAAEPQAMPERADAQNNTAVTTPAATARAATTEGAPSAARPQASDDANVPDWYRKARQHAKREPESEKSNTPYRSRFAAALDATEERLHEQDLEREEEARKEADAERQRQMIAEAAQAKAESARRAEQERVAEEEAARQVEQLRAAQEQKAREEEARAEEARRAEQERRAQERAERERAQMEAARRAEEERRAREEAERAERDRQEEARRAAEQRAAEEHSEREQASERVSVSRETPLPGATVAMQPVVIDRNELAREAKTAHKDVSRETPEFGRVKEEQTTEATEVREQPVAADAPGATTAMAPIDVSDLLAEMKGMQQDEPKVPTFIAGEEESVFLPEDEAEEQAEEAKRAEVSYREAKPAPASEPTPEETAAQRLVDPNAPFIPVIAEEDSAAAAKRAINHEPLMPEATQRIALPELPEKDETLPPIVESTKQRAPLADVTENKAKKAARSLLSTVLPEIGAKAKEATGAINLAAKKHLADLPSLSGELRGTTADQELEEKSTIPTEETAAARTPVSQTGSLSTAGATGSFTAVSNDLVVDADMDDLYVQDADDSEYAENFTETGAFAGPGYVDMPKSRMQKLFGKFGLGRKKKHEEELSAHEWLDVSDDFDARSVGKQRGGWESFQEGADGAYYDEFSASNNAASGDSRYVPADDAYPADSAPLPASSPLRRGATFQDASLEDAYAEDVDDEYADDTKRWNGGAVSSDRANGEDAPVEQSANAHEAVSSDEAVSEELKQIYQFRNPDIDTEVWFVALGAELSGNKGMKQFLADHASELKRAVVINLEGLGAGDLTFLQKEGVLKKYNASSRTKRSLRKASQATGVSCATSEIHWKESAASVAMSHRLQGMTLVGMEHGKPAHYGDALDTVDEVSEERLQQSADFVLAMLKNI